MAGNPISAMRRHISFTPWLGLPGDGVRLEPYTAVWKWLFRREWLLLRACLIGYAIDIQHIGSTAIPGMIAKPILDIAVTTADYEQARPCTELLPRFGYVYRGEADHPAEPYPVPVQCALQYWSRLPSLVPRSGRW
jgi:GrpB-like predicted nucleotidyltransferase (UPF0157 family)